MANAKVETKTVVTTVINLELSYTQAVALLMLTNMAVIGEGQLRNATSEVADALISAGVQTEGLSNFISGYSTFHTNDLLGGILETAEGQFLARVTGNLRNIRDSRIDAELSKGRSAKIPAIKLLRELGTRFENGNKVTPGLKESKDEIDRRFDEGDYLQTPWYDSRY
jgi:hypothetical protein